MLNSGSLAAGVPNKAAGIPKVKSATEFAAVVAVVNEAGGDGVLTAACACKQESLLLQARRL